MKRDPELIRSILLRIEGHDGSNCEIDTSFDGFDEATVRYHVALLIEANFIRGSSYVITESLVPMAVPGLLTWAGHEYLDSIRPKERWDKIKTAIGKTGSVGFAAIQQIATRVAASELAEALK